MPLQWLVALGLAVITLGAIAIFVTQYTKRRQTAIAALLMALIVTIFVCGLTFFTVNTGSR